MYGLFQCVCDNAAYIPQNVLKSWQWSYNCFSLSFVAKFDKVSIKLGIILSYQMGPAIVVVYLVLPLFTTQWFPVFSETPGTLSNSYNK